MAAVAGVQSVSRAQLQPGDLCVWQTHMGIYVGGGQMISALDPAQGTMVTTIADGSPAAEILFCKRLRAVTIGGAVSHGPAPGKLATL